MTPRWRPALRVHLVIPVWAAAELISAAPAGAHRMKQTILAIAAFVVVAAVRELGRAMFASRLGREAETVVLWPVGGLTTFAGPSWGVRGGRRVFAECGGLLLQMAIVPMTALALSVGMQASGAVSRVDPAFLIVFNPFAPGPQIDHPAMTSTGLAAIWWLHYANVVILGLNALLPLGGLDAGRIAEAVSSRESESLRPGTARGGATFGIAMALVVLVLAMAGGEVRLMALALLSGFVAWLNVRRDALAVQGGAGGWRNDALVPLIQRGDWRHRYSQEAAEVGPAATGFDGDDGEDVDGVGEIDDDSSVDREAEKKRGGGFDAGAGRPAGGTGDPARGPIAGGSDSSRRSKDREESGRGLPGNVAKPPHAAPSAGSSGSSLGSGGALPPASAAARGSSSGGPPARGRDAHSTDPSSRIRHESPGPGRGDELEAALDEVLAKISRDGMGSLSAQDRQTLARATERRRRG